MKQRGIISLALAAVLCSIGGVCIKYIPWSPMSINGARCAIAAALTAAYLIHTKHRIRINATVICGAMSLALTTILYVFSTKLTSAACAILLMYTSPIWVMLYLWIKKHQRPSSRALITIVGVFAGLCFFVADGLSSGRLLGNLLGLCSGISYAGVFIFGADLDGDAKSSYFLGQVAGALVGLPFLATERAFPPISILCILLLGIFQLGLSYLLMAYGLAHTPALSASLITALEPVLTPVWVALFYKEIPAPLSLVGMLLVLVCILYYNTEPETRRR